MQRASRWPERALITIALTLGLVIALPLLMVVSSLASPHFEVWSHLRSTVLGGYLQQSLLLAVGVALGTALLAVPAAWCLTLYRVPAAGVFDAALLLPAALPGFIVAYAYGGLIDFGGPWYQLQQALAEPGARYHPPPLRSLGGAVLVLSAVLYPYVFVLVRSAFARQSPALLEVGRSLGLSPRQLFLRVGLPLVRPALLAGAALAAMESLADYGTVQYLGVSTLSVGVFRTWFGLGDRTAATQLAALLLALVLVALWLEHHSRAAARYGSGNRGWRPLARLPLRGLDRLWAGLALLLPLVLGFLLPVGQLLYWALPRAGVWLTPEFHTLIGRSLLLAATASLLGVGAAWLLVNARRRIRATGLRALLGLSVASYAMPGVVIAVGVLVPLGWLDNQLDGLWRLHFGVPLGLLLTGTTTGLLLAYLVRFNGIGVSSIEAGLARVSPNLEEAAQGLGLALPERLWRVQLPVLRGSLAAALLLMFVEVLKELPATLLLRPFDYTTLAIRVYELAADERVPEAAPAAVALMLAGLIPVGLLARSLSYSPARS